ncbi:hypothetical protein P153DRAFT_411043 [Dothidotthia symphoricarpi CBS 119687]|uniref:Uncharacterized protein n=1 Tax=Dothidotthia symphoricarpi CBS 119687 TaxID=1392245 RepID=A0A6A6A0P8_9PLEO|nr:uncharacterized protein P153DRAFT_411043 [Dothidotthia symphoricarpi CBS 119687]KAF2124723.1 hypothetical protein P153DRAFT_411043 [Dothidotthia symphoricarpi CBS 119687]
MANYNQQFHATYTPCTPQSNYHDLACNHRVHVDHNFGCGSNCRVAVPEQPYVCPECLVADVRLDMQLDDLSLDASKKDGGEGGDRLRGIVDVNLQRLLERGYRVCRGVPKLDPALQFFNQFLEEEGLGGVGERSVTPRIAAPRQRVYKRPGRGARAGLERRAEAAAATAARTQRAGLERDDAATEAVREALQALALASNTA